MSTPPPLAATGVTKRYGRVVALRDVDVALSPGSVRAIVGENGAGKSTLTGVLAGVVRPDTGEVLVDGVPRHFASRRSAIAAGVGLVPQQLSLIGELTLVENYLVGQAWGPVRPGKAREALRDVAADIGVDLPLDVPTDRLGLAQRQLGEVLIAIAHGARVLLLDEPTSLLGPGEVERLMATVRKLADRGVALGLVTHRIGEVLGGADEVTVLRGGELIHSGSTHGLDAAEIARMMVGDRMTTYDLTGGSAPGPVIMRVSGVHTEHGAGIVDLEDVTLELRAGEVAGIAGVVGSGQVSLAEVMTGVLEPTRGSVHLQFDEASVDVTGRAALATRLGVRYIPEARDEGLHPAGSVAENASLLRIAERARNWLRGRDRAAERAHGREVIDRFGVRPPDPSAPAAGLSGGNRQKLLVGRELTEAPKVVIAHGPTQGLDLAAGAAIRRDLRSVADDGAAVVVISADLDEILGLADRIVVLAGGHVVEELHANDDGWNLDRLGAAMAGIPTTTAPMEISHDIQ